MKNETKMKENFNENKKKKQIQKGCKCVYKGVHQSNWSIFNWGELGGIGDGKTSGGERVSENGG